MKRIQKVLAHLCAAAISIAAVPLPEAAFLRSAAAQTGITRAEWIHELVTVFDMSVPDETELETCCTDTGSSTYAHDIEGSVAFGCEMPGHEYHIHGANEVNSIDELLLGAKMFTQIILDMCC